MVFKNTCVVGIGGVAFKKHWVGLNSMALGEKHLFRFVSLVAFKKHWVGISGEPQKQEVSEVEKEIGNSSIFQSGKSEMTV